MANEVQRKNVSGYAQWGKITNLAYMWLGSNLEVTEQKRDLGAMVENFDENGNSVFSSRQKQTPCY